MKELNIEEKNGCQISGIGSDQIPMLWPQVEPMIQSALDHSRGEYNLDTVYSMLMQQYMQLWMIADADGIRGVVVTEMQTFPTKQVCTIAFVAGVGLADWDYIIEPIEEWAFAEGADAMYTKARPGWKPYAKKYGYDLAYHVYAKPLRVRDEDKH